MGLKRIRRAVREDRYEYTAHALEEMDEDALSEEDVRHAMLHGSLESELTDDPRGVRFILRGQAQNENAEIEVVCRFMSSGIVRIITAYVIEEK